MPSVSYYRDIARKISRPRPNIGIRYITPDGRPIQITSYSTNKVPPLEYLSLRRIILNTGDTPSEAHFILSYPFQKIEDVLQYYIGSCIEIYYQLPPYSPSKVREISLFKGYFVNRVAWLSQSEGIDLVAKDLRCLWKQKRIVCRLTNHYNEISNKSITRLYTGIDPVYNIYNEKESKLTKNMSFEAFFTNNIYPLFGDEIEALTWTLGCVLYNIILNDIIEYRHDVKEIYHLSSKVTLSGLKIPDFFKDFFYESFTKEYTDVERLKEYFLEEFGLSWGKLSDDNYRPLATEIKNFNTYNRTICQAITELLNQINCTWYIDFTESGSLGEIKLVDLTTKKQQDKKASKIWAGKVKKLFYPKYNTNLYSKSGNLIRMKTVDFKETRIRIEDLKKHDSALVLGEPIRHQVRLRLRRGWTKKEEELIWEKGWLMDSIHEKLGKKVDLPNHEKAMKMKRAMWLMPKAHNFHQDSNTPKEALMLESFFTLGPLSKSYIDPQYAVKVSLEDFPWLKPYATDQEKTEGVIDLNTPIKSWLAVSRVGRLFILDELGEYSYDPSNPTEAEINNPELQSYLGELDDYSNINAPFDFTKVFGHDYWTPRYRPFLKKLLTEDDSTNDVQVYFNIKLGKNWFKNVPIKRQFRILKNRGGIYFTGKLGAFGDMTLVDANLAQRSDEFPFNVDEPFWYVIVEAIIEEDLRLAYNIEKDSRNRRIFDITYYDISRQKYFRQYCTKEIPNLNASEYSPNPWNSNINFTESEPVQDDYNKMRELILNNPDIFKTQKVVRFTLPGFVPDFKLGDVIDKIEGRNYNIEQVIVRIVYDLENMQTEICLQQPGMSNL